jgi:hypothetical protein
MKQASSATMPSNKVMTTNVSGSVGLMPKSAAASARVAATESDKPITTPISNAEPYVLNHLVLPSFRLQPQRIRKRARAVPQQIQSGSPVQVVPAGKQRFAVLQFHFPILPPAGAQSTRHDHAY